MKDTLEFCDVARHASLLGMHTAYPVIVQKKAVRTCALDQYLRRKEVEARKQSGMLVR